MSENSGPGDCRVCAALRNCRREFAAIAGFSAFENILLLAIPLYMMQVYDRVLASRSVETLIYLTLIVIVTLAVIGTLNLARSRLLQGVGLWLDRKLAPGLFERAVQSRLKGQGYGPEAMQDLAGLRGFLASPAMLALFDLPWTPVFILAAFFLHPALGVLAIVSAAILLGLAALSESMTKRKVGEMNVRQMLNRQHLDGTSRNAEVIEAMGMMGAVSERWLTQNDQALGLMSEVSQRTSLLTAVTKWFRMLVQVIGLGLSAYLVILQEVSAGVVIASSIILTRAIGPIEQSIGAWKNIASVRDSIKRLKAFAMEPSYRQESMPLPRPEGKLAVEGLFYRSANPAAPPVLKGLSFELQPGEALAVVGPSGAGKTTLARLLVGAIPASAGLVRLDGANVFTWERSSFGSHVGYMPQDVELFAGTVAENIARMGVAGPDEIVAAATMADVHRMILELPNGYETQIGANGQYLSGGQRQRIALARALVGRPSLVVLDEPNSNLDGEGETALLGALGALKRARATVVVITHRPALVQHVDKMLLLRDGAVEAFGPRQDVIARLVAQAAPAAPAAAGGDGAGAAAPQHRVQ